MKSPTTAYQDLVSELDAYEPSVTIEAISTARAIAERLQSPALAVIADATETSGDK
jgi:hypothetical protein